jgi:arylsulfatase A-like enzyme
MKELLIFPAAMLLTSSIYNGLMAGNAPSPNIIIILADDMGYSDIGCFGGEIHTPHLDGLAKNGLLFTQFYNMGRCCPTRASLLTGLYPHQTGVGYMMNNQGADGYRGDLNNRCVTIAEVLKPAGYETMMCGKWHVTNKVNVKKESEKYNWPLQRGFDRFYGTISGACSYWDPSDLTRGNSTISAFNDSEYTPEKYYYTDAITDHAVRFISEHDAEKPFFMYVAYTAAHWPLHAFPEDILKYDGRYDKGYAAIREERYGNAIRSGVIREQTKLSEVIGDWTTVPDQEWESACMEVYAAMVDRMDQGIGKIINVLKEKGDFDNTLIFYLQDNGASAEDFWRDPLGPRVERGIPGEPMDPGEFQHGQRPQKTRDGYTVREGHVMPGPADTGIGYGRNWANVSNTPFRWYKHHMHEGGISTPLIVHWPAGIKSKGELRDVAGHLIDIMPTCLELANAEYPHHFKGNAVTPPEGKSLVPAFKNHQVDREYLIWEHGGNRALRAGKWKIVANGKPGVVEVPWELYDLENDRSETNDLSRIFPEKVREMSQMWKKQAERTGIIPWPQN